MSFYEEDEGYHGQQQGYRGRSYRGGGGGGGGGYRGRSSSYQNRGPAPRRQPQQPPLHTEKLYAERKVFFLDLKENDRGRVVKITEDVRGRRDTVMLPIEMLQDFIISLQRISEFDATGEITTPEPERNRFQPSDDDDNDNYDDQDDYQSDDTQDSATEEAENYPAADR